jgi:hypothetical protein
MMENNRNNLIMLPFHHRFQLKTSTIGKDGILSVQKGFSVNQPKDYQVHSPVMKILAKNIIMPKDGLIKINPVKKYDTEPTSPVKFDGIEDFKLVETPRNQIETAQKHFTPYTIQDYYSIKPRKYYELGGLGPMHIGSDDWTRKKLKSQRRKNYGLSALKSSQASIHLNIHIRSMSSSL